MARYEVLTFDCYGTLIDWEGGMRAALASVIEKRGLSLSAEEVHRKYAEIEPSIQEGIGGKYVEVMRMGVEQTFRHFGVEVSEEEAGVFGDTLGSWPKFSDTTEALTEMKARGYKLVILSNTDEKFIRQSIETIGVEFDEVITAQAVGSYKPARGSLGPDAGNSWGIEGSCAARGAELLPRRCTGHRAWVRYGVDKPQGPGAVG